MSDLREWIQAKLDASVKEFNIHGEARLRLEGEFTAYAAVAQYIDEQSQKPRTCKKAKKSTTSK